ncbi:unnamed protein product [Camellia sinensis]
MYVLSDYKIPQRATRSSKEPTSLLQNSITPNLYLSRSLSLSEEVIYIMEFIRKGPWTEEEDSTLVNYITIYGEGPWNSVAQCAGKSCRLRWLNYLRPDVRRGNLTLQEQFLILHLHLRWGNRWSKIAQQLPGRTDNEIKNYWRTRIQKQAKQLNCDVNSNEFRDTIRNFLLPSLVDQIQAESDALSSMAEPTSIHDSSATETWMIASSSQQQFLEKQSVFTDCDSDHVLANIWLNISSLTDWGGCFGGTGLTSDRNNACCEQDMFDDAEEEEEETMEYRKASRLAGGGGGGWGSVDTMLYYDGGEEEIQRREEIHPCRSAMRNIVGATQPGLLARSTPMMKK